MATKARKPKTSILRSKEQRRAIASPLRLELIGLFADRVPLSVAQIAERMGRPATAMHYHVRVLEKAGLIRLAGERRAGSRPEKLYIPAADLFMLGQGKRKPDFDAKTAVDTMSTAFRMALGDMKFAMDRPTAGSQAAHHDFFGMRLHCRVSKKQLADLNRQLRDIEKRLNRINKTQKPSPDDTFISLTLALMPLRNREVQS